MKFKNIPECNGKPCPQIALKKINLNFYFGLHYDYNKIKLMANREIAQKVIDFQFSRAHIKDQIERQQEDEEAELAKFSQWNLQQILSGLGLNDSSFYKIKWVGCQEGNSMDAFVYSLFKGCRSGFAARNGVFIKLKFSIYQMACKYLKMGDQKAIVEVLCGAQYTKDLANFLNRNQSVLKLFNKLLKGHLEQIKNQIQPCDDLHKLKLFSSTFDFIKFNVINESVGQIQHFDQKFYIIKEKGCCFLIEVQQENHGIIKLKKIMEAKPEDELFYCRQNPEEKKCEQKQKVKSYAVPKFLMANNKETNSKKHKKEARYTQIEIDQDFLAQFRRTPMSPKIKTLDPSLASRTQHIISQRKIPIFYDVRGSLQPHPTFHELSNQKIRASGRQKQVAKFYKNFSWRAKTGFLDQNTKRTKVTNGSKSKSPHENNFDEKIYKKPGLKKIELSLKKIMTPFNSSAFLKSRQVAEGPSMESKSLTPKHNVSKNKGALIYNAD